MKPHSDTIDSYNIYPTQKIWPTVRLQQEDVMLYKQLWDLITKTFSARKLCWSIWYWLIGTHLDLFPTSIKLLMPSNDVTASLAKFSTYGPRTGCSLWYNNMIVNSIVHHISSIQASSYIKTTVSLLIIHNGITETHHSELLSMYIHILQDSNYNNDLNADLKKIH